MRRTYLPLAGALLLALAADAQSLAHVEQVGTSNTVDVTQVSVGHSPLDVRVRQVDGGNWASITQDGGEHVLAGLDGGSAFQSGGSWLDIVQSGGVGNRTFLEQHDGSWAKIRQDGSANEVLLDQRDGSFLDLLQEGASNWASVLQGGGAGNQAYVVQGGNAVADVAQWGVDNVARITQRGP